VLPQPRHARVETLVGDLAQSQVEPHVLVGQPEALGELGDVVREKYSLTGRPERQPDVGRTHDLTGQLTQRLTDLRTEDGTAQLAQHAGHLTRELLSLGRQRVAHRPGDMLGDRVDDRLPDGQRVLDPFGPAPGRGGG
jgi:hypothetical protein